MRIEIRNDSVLLDGYVNVVDRCSKPIPSLTGKFIEKIEPRAFQKALDKSENIDLLLNHEKSKKLGSTQEGNLQLFEDNIGLRAICTVYDKDVIEKATNNQLKGWSFGFYAEKDNWKDTDKGYQLRTVKELELFEVSIVDNTKNPAYIATSIEMREENEIITENRCNSFKAIVVNETRDENGILDYSSYESEIKMLKQKSYK